MINNQKDILISNAIDRLEAYKKLIDDHINQFMPLLESQISEQFGEYPCEAIKPFVSYMRRGGKRIRGSLVIVGYEMFGGKDMKMIVEAAMAIEMLQSYLLIMDDIQDRSDIRRGGPTAHVALANYHRQNYLRGDSEHFGVSVAMNSYLLGCHYALDIISSLETKPERVIKALKNIHKSYITTAHGQTLDIFSEVMNSLKEKDADNILLWKTAYYTFVNPIQFGAILAGAKDEDLNEIFQYAIPAGKAYQLADDITGIFASESENGKNPMDDIKDGKRTLMILRSLELAPKAEAYYLEQCLGKRNLSIDEFRECQRIINDSGAKGYAISTSKKYSKQAIDALQIISKKCDYSYIEFLSGLTNYLIDRKY